MDDSCAVCAESLDWVAYGPCGHREVCSTCVVRLRFILNDRRCCICKSDNPHVFITKAMGDYTRVITDFAMFPAGATEGRNGEFWYHEDTQAYFDDADQYRMIKATCKLSCSVCDSSSDYSGPRRISAFKNIDQLKAHLHHQHRLLMCLLCLEGRKVFICEQRLYNRSQLDQHVKTGDSEVDGSEHERGGFMGHPMCDFCKSPFYGDNELFVHMSRDHYKCFICERQHPGQYDYYMNYNDLEIHFRQGHFLCEDENCLQEKFVVFQTEAEMKRHHAAKHGGNMTRAQRKDAFQIPTSFRYQRNNEQDQRRNRGRGFRSGDFFRQSNAEGSSSTGTRSVSNMTETHRSAEMNSLESLTLNPDAESSSSVSHTQSSRSTPIIEESSFPPLSDRVPAETSSRYAQLVNSSRNPARLGEESFPPLPGGETRSKPKANPRSENLGKSSLAAHLRNKRAVVVVHKAAWSRPSENSGASPSVSASSQNKPARKPGISSPAISQSKVADQGSPSTSSVVQVKPVRENELTLNSSLNSNAANKMRHSVSAPTLVGGGSTPSMASTLRGSQAMGTSPAMPTNSRGLPDVKDVHTANKSLIDRIRAGVEMNEDRFTAFKNISLEYRQDQINTWEYLSYVQQFGLSHLTLELAHNCPDPRKQKELIDAYNANFRGKVVQENGGNSAPSPREGKQGKTKAKGKGKEVDYGNSSSTTDALTDSILDSVRKLQSYAKPQEEEVETLSKDGYRKQQLLPKKGQASSNLSGSNGSREASVNSTNSNQNVGGGGSSKQKKTSKFHRIRLGDGVDPGPANASPERSSSQHEEEGVVPVRGVWRNGGGLKIVKSQKNQ